MATGGGDRTVVNRTHAACDCNHHGGQHRMRGRGRRARRDENGWAGRRRRRGPESVAGKLGLVYR